MAESSHPPRNPSTPSVSAEKPRCLDLAAGEEIMITVAGASGPVPLRVVGVGDGTVHLRLGWDGGDDAGSDR